MTKCFCDRCKKEIVDPRFNKYDLKVTYGSSPVVFIDRGNETENKEQLKSVTINKELCKDCLITLYQKIADVVNDEVN